MEIVTAVSIIAGAASTLFTFISSLKEKRLAKNVVNKESKIKVEIINNEHDIKKLEEELSSETYVNKIAVDYYETISEFSINDYMNNEISKRKIDEFLGKISNYKRNA